MICSRGKLQMVEHSGNKWKDGGCAYHPRIYDVNPRNAHREKLLRRQVERCEISCPMISILQSSLIIMFVIIIMSKKEELIKLRLYRIKLHTAWNCNTSRFTIQ